MKTRMAMSVDDLIAVFGRADSLYARRGEPGAVKESIDLLTDCDSRGEKYEAQWRISRAHFFLGQETARNPEKYQLHQEGIRAGLRAKAINEDRVEGRFWLGVNLALFAECAGGIKAAGAILSAKRELHQAAKISPEYHDAGPLRVLGRIYHKAPWFIGGSHAKSRACFERALALAGSNSVTLIYAAEFEMDAGKKDRAIELLERVIALPPEGDWEFEKRRDTEIARLWLERLQNDKAGR